MFMGTYGLTALMKKKFPWEDSRFIVEGNEHIISTEDFECMIKAIKENSKGDNDFEYSYIIKDITRKGDFRDTFNFEVIKKPAKQRVEKVKLDYELKKKGSVVNNTSLITPIVILNSFGDDDNAYSGSSSSYEPSPTVEGGGGDFGGGGSSGDW